MGVTFKAVGSDDQPSIQEQEIQIQQEFDEQSSGDSLEIESQDLEVQDDSSDIDDARVLNYLKDRYQKEYSSLDEVLTSKEKTELPEDVKKLMEFGVDNYIKINKDWDTARDADVLKEYYKQTKPHLDDEDVNYLLEEEYSFDEDIDDERDIKKKRVALKEELFRAKTYLNNLKEQYKVDLGANSAGVTEDYKKAFDFYQEYEQRSKKESETAQQKASVFNEKTEKLFSNDFKGFEFNLGDKKQVYKPKDVNETKRVQSDISSVIGKHISEDGTLKDAHQYHKALAMFRDPDGVAKFFYEQGKADATDGVIKNVKNIDMSVRDRKDVSDTGSGPRIRVVNDDDFSGGLKIKKR